MECITVPEKGEKVESNQTFGAFLASLRRAAQLSLRQVEDLTEKQVSNAYLSQLENDKISQPSPGILGALAKVYKVPYELLMERAGYLSSGKPRPATFAIADLTTDEESALIAYLDFYRKQKKK
jgi:HTH-type transcriptional regulator, competence development regulator